MYIRFILFYFLLFFFQSLEECAHAATNSTKANRYRIGVGIAGEYASIDLSLHNRTSESLRAEGTYSANGHHSCRKLQLSPSMEFGLTIKKDYYLGLIFGYHYTRVSTYIKNSLPYSYFLEHEFKLNSSTDALFKFGYTPIQKMMIFALAGPSFASWEHNTRTFLLKDVNNLEMRRCSGSRKKTVGLSLGAGFEFLMHANYALDCFYALTLHPPQSVSYQTSYAGRNNAPPIISDRVLDVQKSVRLSYSTIGLRFSYFFSL